MLLLLRCRTWSVGSSSLRRRCSSLNRNGGRNACSSSTLQQQQINQRQRQARRRIPRCSGTAAAAPAAQHSSSSSTWIPTATQLAAPAAARRGLITGFTSCMHASLRAPIRGRSCCRRVLSSSSNSSDLQRDCSKKGRATLKQWLVYTPSPSGCALWGCCFLTLVFERSCSVHTTYIYIYL